MVMLAKLYGEFAVIVALTVKHNNYAPVLIEGWLVAAIQVITFNRRMPM
jgi:hypothetical protein